MRTIKGKLVRTPAKYITKEGKETTFNTYYLKFAKSSTENGTIKVTLGKDCQAIYDKILESREHHDLFLKLVISESSEENNVEQVTAWLMADTKANGIGQYKPRYDSHGKTLQKLHIVKFVKENILEKEIEFAKQEKPSIDSIFGASAIDDNDLPF